MRSTSQHRAINVFFIIIIFQIFYLIKVFKLPAERSEKNEGLHEKESNTKMDKPANIPDKYLANYGGFFVCKKREEMGTILEGQKYKRGAEVGVWRGDFAKIVLEKWTSCEQYSLVDTWSLQKNYFTGVNVDLVVDVNVVKNNLIEWKDKCSFYQNRSHDAAVFFGDASLDYIYIDARHDYCAVKKDLELYWPKVRPGGMLTGHDYVISGWDVCEDGHSEYGGVRRAVNEFAIDRGLPIGRCDTSFVLVKPE